MRLQANMARMFGKVTSAVIYVLYLTSPLDSSPTLEDFENHENWAYTSNTEIYYDYYKPGQQTAQLEYVGPAIQISRRLLRTDDLLLMICRKNSKTSYPWPCKLVGGHCTTSKRFEQNHLSRCPKDTTNKYECMVGYYSINHFTAKDAGLYACRDYKSETYLVSWFNKTDLRAQPASQSLTVNRLRSIVSIDCAATIIPLNQDYGNSFDIDWKFKGSNSSKWVPVVGGQGGIQFLGSASGPKEILLIGQYHPVLHDGEYQCHAKYYTIGRHSNVGTETGTSNIVKLHFESTTSWKTSSPETKDGVLLIRQGGVVECFVRMYPIPDKIEIKADGNMISSSVRIVPASLNHAATVKATDIYGTFQNGSRLSCHATNSRGSVEEESKPIYFVPSSPTTTARPQTAKTTTKTTKIVKLGSDSGGTDKEATAVPIAVPIFGLATVFVIGLLIGVVVFKQRDESQIVPMQADRRLEDSSVATPIKPHKRTRKKKRKKPLSAARQ